MTRVAVVIPCFNDGSTLAETLSSLADQEPHELVIVDDGSTDPATLALLDELRDAGTRVVRQENTGLAGARMRGVAETTSRYVQPLDADDLLEPGALADLADALDANPDAAASWGDVVLFGEFDATFRTADRFDPWLIWHLSDMPGTSMFRRDALTAAGGWVFRDAYEDWDLWMAIAERGYGGVRVPRVVLRYRRDPDRMNAGGLERHTELAAVVRGRHPLLRAQRFRNWLSSPAPVHVRLLFPLIEVLPGLDDRDRIRVKRLVRHPRRTVNYRKARRYGGRVSHPRAGEEYQPRRYWSGLHRADDELTAVGYPTLPLVFNRHLYRNVAEATLRDVHVRGRRVLDVGSGTGFWVGLWRDEGAAEVAGSDLVPEAVERLRERFPGSEFAVADITEQVPFPDERFDIVTIASVLHHIVEPQRFERALENLAAQLEPDGRLVVIDPLVVRGRWQPAEGAHNVTRTRAQWDAAAAVAGLRIDAVTPVVSFLLSDPVDAGSRTAFAAQRAWWRGFAGALGGRDALAAAVVPPVAALDRAVVRRSRSGTSSKLIVLSRAR